MLFRVSGRFANGHTFSVNPVDGEDARDALEKVTTDESVSGYGFDVVSVTVKALTGSKRKIRISEKPAAERKPSKPRVAPTREEAAAATPKPTRRR